MKTKIEIMVFVIMCCVLLQTVWFIGEKVLIPEEAIAQQRVVDVNISAVDGIKLGQVVHPYYRAIPIREIIK
jgi:hypothetical protein